MWIRTSVVLCALSVAMPAWAQGDACSANIENLLDKQGQIVEQGTTSVEQAISLALQNDLRFEAANARVAASRAQEVIAGLRPSDELRFQTEEFPRSNQAGDLDTLEVSASYARKWERGGKRDARKAIAASGVDVAQAGVALSESQIAYDIRNLYAAVLIAKARQSIECMEITHVSEIKEITKRRVSRSVDPQLALSRISTELMTARADLIRYQALEQALTTQLAERVGRDLVLDSSALRSPLTVQAVDINFSQLPDLLLLEAIEREAGQRVFLEEANRKADIDWSVGVRNYGASDEVGLITSFSVPLGTNKRGSAAKAKARADKFAISAEKNAQKQRLAREVSRLRQSSLQAVNVLQDLNTKIIPEATKALELAESGYARGALPFRDILEAHEVLIGLHKQRVDYLEIYLMNDIALKRYSGKSISVETSNE